MAFALLKATAFILGDVWSRARAEQCRLNDIYLASRIFPLGGSRFIGIEGTGAQDCADYLNLTLDGTVLAGFTIRARVEVFTDDAGTTVQPKIRDITASSDLVVGSASSSLLWAEQVLTMSPLPAAVRQYRLQLVKSNASARVYGIGVVEVLAP